MSFYTEKAETARRLLEKYGQAGAIKRISRTGGGPSDQGGATESITHTTARIAVFPREDGRIDGTNIIAGDYQIICEALGFLVSVDDFVICSEGELAIKELGKIAPAGEVVAYDMVCRK